MVDKKQVVGTKEEQDKVILDTFLNNSDNKKNVTQLAFQIQKEMKDNWFTISNLLKAFKIKKEEAEIRFTVLRAFNLLAVKQGSNTLHYKIDLNQREQRILISQEIVFFEAQILILKEKLTKLN